MDPITKNTECLLDLKTGESAFIQALKAGKGINSRLSSLGFTPGVAIQMSHNYGHGPVVVIVRDTRIALGRGEAKSILITRNTDGRT